MDLLLVTDEKSDTMCITWILTDLCFTKQRIKIKNTFVKVVYSVLLVKMCRQNK